jgi:hypothetical protein
MLPFFQTNSFVSTLLGEAQTTVEEGDFHSQPEILCLGHDLPKSLNPMTYRKYFSIFPLIS